MEVNQRELQAKRENKDVNIQNTSFELLGFERGAVGGQAVESDEPERKQGNVFVKHSDIVHYVCLNGRACIIAERYKENKPISPNAYLVFDEHGNFTKKI